MAADSAVPAAERQHVLRIDFNDFEVGHLTPARLRDHIPEVTSVILPTHARIDLRETTNRVLTALYPKGAVGPQEGGATFIVNLPPGQAYRFSYRVWVSDNFDFANGGKLPGLCSGGGRYSGGVIPTSGDGWSARFTWGRTGTISLYLYYAGMTGPWGEVVPTTGVVKRGQWHTVVQSVHVNAPGRVDGRIQAWIDGEAVLDLSQLELRKGIQGRIDSICFSTFHGGRGPDFAPSTSGSMMFDDIEVSREVMAR